MVNNYLKVKIIDYHNLKKLFRNRWGFIYRTVTGHEKNRVNIKCIIKP